MNKRKTRWMICSVLLVLVLAVGVFYAYYQMTHKSDVSEGTLITITDVEPECQ